MRLAIIFLLCAFQAMGQLPLVTAHRGASGYAPENTISAVRKALEIGVDRVEVDVQQTADGVVVCLHDKTLNRTTSGEGKVKNYTWSELQNVTANRDFEMEFPDEKIPTLEEVFKLMDGETQFVIEIKAGRSTYPEIEDNVVQLVKKYDAEKWALVHSFNDRVLEYLDDNYPEIRLQKLFVSKPSWLPLMLDFRLHFAALSDYSYVEGFGVSKGAVSQYLVDRIHQLNQVIHVWTVNSEDDIDQMLDYGVDGIISNYPDRVKQLKAQRKN